MGMGTGTVSRPIGLVDMDICRSLRYNFGSGIIIPEQNPTRCHPYTCAGGRARRRRVLRPTHDGGVQSKGTRSFTGC
jgi:hypothetical protein